MNFLSTFYNISKQKIFLSITFNSVHHMSERWCRCNLTLSILSVKLSSNKSCTKQLNDNRTYIYEFSYYISNLSQRKIFHSITSNLRAPYEWKTMQPPISRTTHSTFRQQKEKEGRDTKQLNTSSFISIIPSPQNIFYQPKLLNLN